MASRRVRRCSPAAQEPAEPVEHAAQRPVALDDGCLWQDLADACPELPWKLILKALCFAMSVVTYVAMPALRVDNGSADSCDPVRTYGEITQEGMRAFRDAIGREEPGTFVDVGSGHGTFVQWACRHGGFSRCIGVELDRERHDSAEKHQRQAGTPGVHFLHGDIRDHLHVVMKDVSHIYWNNLCFPSDITDTVARAFAGAAPLGSELWTLADLPIHPGAVRGETTIDLLMNWRADTYRPFRFLREEA